jgi:UPF0755 protein
MIILNIVYHHKKNVLISALAFFFFITAILLFYALTPIDSSDNTVMVEIPRGTSFSGCVDILEKAGIVKNRNLFYLLAISKNAHGHIRAGEYELATSMSPMEIVNKLVRGEIKSYKVTIPEDFTVQEIASRLASLRLTDKKSFMDTLSDQRFLSYLGIESTSGEGYLYPDTYVLDRSMSTKDIIKTMVNQFWKMFTPEMRAKAKELNMTIHEVVTLASIIGKESGYRDEKALISAVFHNRLKKNMKLQSDPTAIYNIENFNGEIRKYLRKNTPYNTYRISGLPPGPISNPAVDSLRAALYPAPVNYLYFVSNNNGSHHFTSTLAAHKRAILKYQTERKKE